VVAVASVLADYADSDGHNAFPSIETMMSEAGVSRRTVRLVLARLVENGWLIITAEAVPWHRPTVYRLTFPMGAEEHPMHTSSRGAVRGAVRGAEEHPDLLPPTREEEESANARSPSGRLAALQSQNHTAPVVEDWMREVAKEITSHSTISDGVDPSHGDLAEQMARVVGLGWSNSQIALEAGELFKRKPPQSNASGLLAKHLRTRVTETYEPSLRVTYAGLWERLWASSEEDALGPIDWFSEMLENKELGSAESVGPWDVGDDQLEQVVFLAGLALRGTGGQ
jgi:hypothetical protein